MLNSHIFREKIPHFIGSPLGTLCHAYKIRHVTSGMSRKSGLSQSGIYNIWRVISIVFRHGTSDMEHQKEKVSLGTSRHETSGVCVGGGAGAIPTYFEKYNLPRKPVHYTNCL